MRAAPRTSATDGRECMLYGREHERAVLDALLAEARAGRSGALVIRGEAGIGKTALLDYAAEAGSDMPVLRGEGIEAETQLPFAALHLLLKRDLDRLESLPRPQAEALRGALGLDAGSGADRFLVGLAVLSLLTELAGDGPLLCLIDDAQWIDQASQDALLFAARRLESEGIALIFAARDGADTFRAPRLSKLPLTGLDGEAAARLLDKCVGPFAARDRILVEAAGNPLALIELPGLLAGAGETTDDGAELPVSRRIEQLYRSAVAALPQRARNLLLVAATDETGELALVLRAARSLGGSAEDLTVAEQAKLVRLTPTRIAFRHPLIRAATYHGAPITARWAAHRALADATGPADADRRARHLAAVATGPDETIAAELAASAQRARSRGALGAAVGAYERAAALSSDPSVRAERLTLAAEAAAAVGDLVRAERLVDQAGPMAADDALWARLVTVRGRTSYALGQLAAAHRHLDTAVTLLRSEQAERAVWLLMEMVFLDNATGDQTAAGLTNRQLDAIALSDGHPLRPVWQLLRWLNAMQLGADTAHLPALPEVAAAALRAGPQLHNQLFAAAACLAVGADRDAEQTLQGLVVVARQQGAIGLLPHALTHLSVPLAYGGRYRDAAATASEGLRIALDTGQHEWVSQANSVLACIAAYQGDEEECRTHARAAIGDDDGPYASPGRYGGQWALGLLELGRGQGEAALVALETLAREAPPLQLVSLRSAPDLVEAAVRNGHPDRAAKAAARFEHWARHTGQPWAEALLLRCRGLLADDDAGSHYEAALQRHDPRRPVEYARTALLYGEWLRRVKRPSDARRQLRGALDTFERVGATLWSERARSELRAAGETMLAPDRPAELLDQLTAQELQIVRLAAAGLSNRAIGAQLFLSPRTVGYHLYKAYPKLGVASRGELARLPLGT